MGSVENHDHGHKTDCGAWSCRACRGVTSISGEIWRFGLPWQNEGRFRSLVFALKGQRSIDPGIAQRHPGFPETRRRSPMTYHPPAWAGPRRGDGKETIFFDRQSPRAALRFALGYSPNALSGHEIPFRIRSSTNRPRKKKGSSSISVGHSAADVLFLPRKEIAFKGQRPVTFQPGPTAQVAVSSYRTGFCDTIRSRLPGRWPGIRERMVFFRTLASQGSFRGRCPRLGCFAPLVLKSLTSHRDVRILHDSKDRRIRSEWTAKTENRNS